MLDSTPPGDRWDLVVIGGGYWGSAVARLARATRGWSVVVLDDGDDEGASRASAGYVRWSWLSGQLGGIVPDWWEDAHTAWSRDLLKDWGAREVTERAEDYKGNSSERSGLFLVNPWEVLSRDFTARVQRVERRPDGWDVLTSLHDAIPAQRVVIAAGVWTDALLSASGFKPLGVEQLTGSALIFAGELDTEARSYMTRPYHHVQMRRWRPGQVRVGETVSKEYPDNKLGALIAEAGKLYPQGRNPAIVTGRRPVLPRATVAELGDGLVVAVGGHRIGLSLAGGIANHVLEVIS